MHRTFFSCYRIFFSFRLQNLVLYKRNFRITYFAHGNHIIKFYKHWMSSAFEQLSFPKSAIRILQVKSTNFIDTCLLLEDISKSTIILCAKKIIRFMNYLF